MPEEMSRGEKQETGKQLKRLTEDQINDAVDVYGRLKKNPSLFYCPTFTFIDFIHWKIPGFLIEGDTDKRPYYSHLAKGNTEADVDRRFAELRGYRIQATTEAEVQHGAKSVHEQALESLGLKGE